MLLPILPVIILSILPVSFLPTLLETDRQFVIDCLYSQWPITNLFFTVHIKQWLPCMASDISQVYPWLPILPFTYITSDVPTHIASNLSPVCHWLPILPMAYYQFVFGCLHCHWLPCPQCQWLITSLSLTDYTLSQNDFPFHIAIDISPVYPWLTIHCNRMTSLSTLPVTYHQCIPGWPYTVTEWPLWPFSVSSTQLPPLL